jgi:hypothetical protein
MLITLERRTSLDTVSTHIKISGHRRSLTYNVIMYSSQKTLSHPAIFLISLYFMRRCLHFNKSELNTGDYDIVNLLRLVDMLLPPRGQTHCEQRDIIVICILTLHARCYNQQVVARLDDKYIYFPQTLHFNSSLCEKPQKILLLSFQYVFSLYTCVLLRNFEFLL